VRETGVIGRQNGHGPEAGPSSAIAKAFTALRVLRRSSSPLALTVIAKELGVAQSSAHAILGHLLAEGAVVQQPDKRYSLGPQLFYLGASFATGTPVYRSTWIELVHAANELSVMAAVAVPWSDHHLVLNSHNAGASDITIPFGGRVPLTASSWGKVYYGWSGQPPPTELVRYTERSVVDREAFLKEIEHARHFGYAIDEGEYFDGIGGVCAPVTSSGGYEGLVSFVAPLDVVRRIETDVLGDRLALLASRASLALGDGERVRFFGRR
jgi:DNA-binding IclR family transcriptional regulator